MASKDASYLKWSRDCPRDFQGIRWKDNGQTTSYLCSTQLLYSDRFVINFALQGVFNGSWTFAFSFPDHTDCVFWTLCCKWLLWNKCQTVRQRATMSPTKMARQLPGNRRVSCRDGRKITMLINWNSLKIGQCTYKLSNIFLQIYLIAKGIVYISLKIS